MRERVKTPFSSSDLCCKDLRRHRLATLSIVCSNHTQFTRFQGEGMRAISDFKNPIFSLYDFLLREDGVIFGRMLIRFARSLPEEIAQGGT